MGRRFFCAGVLRYGQSSSTADGGELLKSRADLAGLNAPAVSAERKKELQAFERHAGVRFKRLGLLNLAFAHRSYSNETANTSGNNEKLEFLGDSVLGLVVAEHLFATLPDKAEGDLAKIKSFVVSEESLAKVAARLEVDRYLLVGRGEEYSGGRKKKAILADAMEAIIGALLVDSGMKSARKFVLEQLVPEIDLVLQNRHRKDYKTLLQEYVQKKYKTYPKYHLTRRSGPDHNKTFWIEVRINDESFGPGQGKNKKQAEQAAAKLAYEALCPSSAANNGCE